MNTRMTTTPGEGTPPTSAPPHSHGGQGNNVDIASSGTQGNQITRDSNTIAFSGTQGNQDTRDSNNDDIASSGTQDASSGTQGSQVFTKRDDDILASSGTKDSIGDASSGTVKATSGKQGTFTKRDSWEIAYKALKSSLGDIAYCKQGKKRCETGKTIKKFRKS